MPTYQYSKSTGRYRNKETGRLVSYEQVAGWVDRAVDRGSNELRAIAEQYRLGRISFPEWVLETQDSIKAMHRATSMIAAGGRDAMTLSDWGRAGVNIREQLRYFNNFANEVANLPEDARLTEGFDSRAASYGPAAYETYQSSLRARILDNGQADWERNWLETAAMHCDECLAETGAGAVPVGTLVPIGDRECGSRCRCYIEYGVGPMPAEEEAA